MMRFRSADVVLWVDDLKLALLCQKAAFRLLPQKWAIGQEERLPGKIERTERISPWT